MQSVIEFIKNPESMVSLATALIAVNLVLSGLSKGLELFKDKTSSQLDNRIWGVLNKASSVLQKAVDWMQGNRAHKKA